MANAGVSNEKEQEAGLSIEELATFCKRKGFVYPSAEIYGGLAGFWDFGHLGTELINNLKREWWKFHVQQREDIAGVDGAIITNPKVWEASGHVSSFVDFIVLNKKTKEKFKVDKHELATYKKNKNFEIIGEFNPMFTTQLWASGESTRAYLRPETAQLIFTQFKAVQENARMRLPFGIAQIGKAFRNEISPREFLFRCREFEQMEMEYFTAPGQKCLSMNQIKDVEIAVLSEEMQKRNQKEKNMKMYDAYKKGFFKKDWHAYWLALHYKWFLSLGAKADNFRARQHLSEERSHYSSDTWDLEYNFPMGWRELEGFADRGTYDLAQHEKYSHASLSIQDPVYGKVLPEVICEPSLGVGRAFIVFMLSAYRYDALRENIVLALHPKLTPVKAAVFPIVKGEAYEKISAGIVKTLHEDWIVRQDLGGSIGKRYARADEIGVPVCITVDEESVKHQSVTLRDRDSTEQIRAGISELPEILRKIVRGDDLMSLGKKVKTRVK